MLFHQSLLFLRHQDLLLFQFGHLQLVQLFAVLVDQLGEAHLRGLPGRRGHRPRVAHRWRAQATLRQVGFRCCLRFCRELLTRGRQFLLALLQNGRDSLLEVVLRHVLLQAHLEFFARRELVPVRSFRFFVDHFELLEVERRVAAFCLFHSCHFD